MPVPYLPSVFNTDLYDTIASKLSKSDRKKLEKELVRVETEQAGVTSRLWDDVYRHACQVVIITKSGRKFCLRGSGWTDNTVNGLPEPQAPAGPSQHKPPRYDNHQTAGLDQTPTQN